MYTVFNKYGVWDKWVFRDISNQKLNQLTKTYLVDCICLPPLGPPKLIHFT